MLTQFDDRIVSVVPTRDTILVGNLILFRASVAWICCARVLAGAGLHRHRLLLYCLPYLSSW